MEICLTAVGVTFRTGVEALHNVTFTVASGELVTVVGPSGCGKSTLLHAIARLLPPNEAEVQGTILLDGRDIQASTVRRSLGYVFQRDALFPWRTVLQNVCAGLEIRGVPAKDRIDRARHFLDLVGLSGFEHYYPHQISGGMRQRTALARTLAYDPQLILMDEPFGALDAQTRMILQSELIRIWGTRRTTIIFVTHDLAEAIILGERVIVFSSRPGTVRGIYPIAIPHPRDPFELRGTKQFAELEAEIWGVVGAEFRPNGGARWPHSVPALAFRLRQ